MFRVYLTLKKGKFALVDWSSHELIFVSFLFFASRRILWKTFLNRKKKTRDPRRWLSESEGAHWDGVWKQHSSIGHGVRPRGVLVIFAVTWSPSRPQTLFIDAERQGSNITCIALCYRIPLASHDVVRHAPPSFVHLWSRMACCSSPPPQSPQSPQFNNTPSSTVRQHHHMFACLTACWISP